MMRYIGRWRDRVDNEIMNHLSGDVPAVWERGKEYFLRGGKRIRPALVMLGAKEAGGSEETVIRLAAAVEILHTFTLIHDDIEDNSDLRRGDECLHIEHGIPLAINAGDLLFAKSFELASSYGPLIAERFAKTVCSIAEGQDQDISWSRGDYLPDEKEYVAMIERKAGVLIGFSLEAGYTAVTGKENIPIRDYGIAIGAAFQIIDDILGVAGNLKKTGKDIDKDILERKKSLPIIKAIELHPKGRELEQIFLKENKTDSDIKFIRASIQESGSIDYCKKLVKNIINGAGDPFKNKEVGGMLKSFSQFVIEREF